MLDGSMDTVIFDQQLDKWTFDEKQALIHKKIGLPRRLISEKIP
jgi:hypothetical protein